MASRPCHSRFGSPISAGVNTVAVRWTLNEKQLLLEPRRPDKAKPPSGNVAADKMPDGAGAYPAYGNGAGLYAAIRQWCNRDNAGWRVPLIRPTRFRLLQRLRFANATFKTII
jgi:hypothetical protein